MQGLPDAAGTDPNWDLLNYPYSSCVSYKKDLSPLQYGDKVSIYPPHALMGHVEAWKHGRQRILLSSAFPTVFTAPGLLTGD